VSAARFDWQAAYARLEALRRAVETGGALSPEEARRILEQRARQLAQPREERVSAAAEPLDLLVFSRSGERYGVVVRHVQQLLPKTSPTPLPGSRPGLAGVANHRGRILAVVDMGGLRPGPGGRPEGRIVAVETRGNCFGLLADEVAGLARVEPGEVTPGGKGNERWVRGTTAGMVSVLDLDALAEDPRIRVEE